MLLGLSSTAICPPIPQNVAFDISNWPWQIKLQGQSQGHTEIISIMASEQIQITYWWFCLSFCSEWPIPSLRVHLNQQGEGPPMGAGAFSAWVECLHWCGSTRSFNLQGPHFMALGHWSINTDQSALPNPAGPAEESRRRSGHAAV